MKETTEKLSIKEWAEEDRPREKMLQKGASVLSDAELIAILIGSGNNEETAVQLSQRILHSVNNNLNKLAKLSIKQLTADFKGIGEAKAVTICAALELGKRRGASEGLQSKQIRSSNDAYLSLQAELRDLPYEELWIILTNPANRILKKCKISQGGINSSAADIRLILKTALMETATGFILCHNHPSGNIRPSRQDDTLTEQVQKAAKIMDLILLDHIILAEGIYYSYADEGKLR
ncbi:RadC family protein [Parabacteroides distasonis]|uniref:DNA repair protein RadC n=1 Tax=Parabacteroides distasonis TaxID=823 RepID=A0A3L7ZKI0_PARDI|nr:DNA repair protein RadC [Parabacteroides distasonis]NBH90449.1 DNA repair protein RadC [Parabacteroides distasonis]RLT72404.1 DNA repair protein RadC [Parabacteroides distasonis]TGY61554.1 DNA repair protein RadC [Parabacteroides distasonis]